MFNVSKSKSGKRVTFHNKTITILDDEPDCILAECNLKTLHGIFNDPFPEKLMITVQEEKGFGTYLFHELTLSSTDGKKLDADFTCLMPNKFWEGHWGLATYLKAISNQIVKSDRFKVKDIKLDDDWKQLTVSCCLSPDPDKTLDKMILDAGHEIKKFIKDAESVLKG